MYLPHCFLISAHMKLFLFRIDNTITVSIALALRTFSIGGAKNISEPALILSLAQPTN